MRTAPFVVALIALFGCPHPRVALAQTAPAITLKPMTVVGDFEAKRKKDDPAADISGIACQPPQGGKRSCLLVNDENRNAQFATIENDTMTVGETVTLIGKDPTAETLGRPPKPTCKKEDEFKDLDGEAIAYVAPYFYVVGSHGCSRDKAKFRLSSFILARIKVDQNGQSAGAAETTYRVSDLLTRAGAAAPFFGKDLETDNGLNIEGIAATRDRLWFGLRAPVGADGAAYLVGGTAADLFQAGDAPSEAKPLVMPVALEGRGIRDMAPLPDGRLLILAGAPHGTELPFKLFVVNPDSGTSKAIGTFDPVSEAVGSKVKVGKAEGIEVIEASPDRVKFVVVFDSLPNGEPQLGEAALPE
jgi:hypothetical protein